MKYEIIDFPIIAIIGKEDLCTKEKNVVHDLWHQANSNFSDSADLGMKNADGSFVGFWGAMSDETMSFMPWTDGFSKGLYLAGVEVYEDTPVPDGWVSRSAGRRGRFLFPLQGVGGRVSRRNHRCISDAARLLCGRRGCGGIRQRLSPEGKAETPGTDFWPKQQADGWKGARKPC